MHPSTLQIKDFTYELPEHRIAAYPLPQRDASKLLLYRHGEIEEKKFRDIAALVPAGSLLVFNNTRVINARLVFKKATGARIEIFCLEPLAKIKDYATVMSAVSYTHLDVYKRQLVNGASFLEKAMHAAPANVNYILNRADVAIDAKDVYKRQV